MKSKFINKNYLNQLPIFNHAHFEAFFSDFTFWFLSDSDFHYIFFKNVRIFFNWVNKWFKLWVLLLNFCRATCIQNWIGLFLQLEKMHQRPMHSFAEWRGRQPNYGKLHQKRDWLKWIFCSLELIFRWCPMQNMHRPNFCIKYLWRHDE